MPYEKQSWVDGQTLSASRLNHIENGLADIEDNYAPVDSVPEVYQAYVAANAATGPATRVTPLAAIDAYGESTTAADWPQTTLATLLGVSVTNRGVAGQGAADILTRSGLLRPQVTLAGNQIPASGAVTVTAIDPAQGWRIGGSGSFAFTGTIAGVEGSLNHDMTAETWSFTRTAPGSVVAVAAGTEFIRKESLITPYNRLVLGTGRNNVLDSTLPLVQDLIGLAMTKLRTQIKKYLIWGVINGTDEPTGHARHTAIIAYNSAMAAQHGANFYDVRRDFIDDGLTMAGITPTTDDTAKITTDRPPPSLMSDNIHPNATGYTVLATLIAEKLLALGWVSSLHYPATMITSDDHNRANTTPGTLGSTNAAFGGAVMPYVSEAQLQIIDNAVGAASLSSNRAAYINDPAALRADGCIEYKKTAVGNGEGVIARRQDTSNYYFLSTGNGTTGAGIYKRIAGVNTAIATSSTQTFNIGDTYALEIIGSALRMFKNGVVVASTTNTDITAAGGWGPRSSFSTISARQDDMKFWDRSPY